MNFVFASKKAKMFLIRNRLNRKKGYDYIFSHEIRNVNLFFV